MKAKELAEFLLKHPDGDVQRQDTSMYGDIIEVDVRQCEVVLQTDGTMAVVIR